MTRYYKFAIILLLIVTSNRSFAVIPNASLTATSSTNVSYGNAVNFEINFTGSFPLSFKMEGKTYTDVNQSTFNLSILITESKWVKIDSVWNIDGSSYPTDSIEITHTQYGPNLLSESTLLGSAQDKGIAYLEDVAENKIIVAQVSSFDRDFAYRPSSNHNILVRKIDKNGLQLWETYFGDNVNTRTPVKTILTSDGGIAIVGYIFIGGEGAGGTDMWITKIDANGNQQWENNFGGIYYDYAFDAVEHINGGFVLCGRSNSNDGDAAGNIGDIDGFMVRVNDGGNKIWSKQFGGTSRDEFKSVTTDSQGNIYAGGYSQSSNIDLPGNFGFTDWFLMKVDSLGNRIWGKNFGGSSFDEINDIIITESDSLAVVGTSGSLGFPNSKSTTNTSSVLLSLNLSGVQGSSKGFETNVYNLNPHLLSLGNDEILVSYDYQTINAGSNNSSKLTKLGSLKNQVWQIRINTALQESINSLFKSKNGFLVSGSSYSLSSFNSYFQNFSPNFYEFSNCPTFSASLLAPAVLTKYDTLKVKLANSSLFPARLLLNSTLWHTFENEDSELLLYPEADTTYNITYGFNQCTLIQTPTSSLTIDINPCPESRVLNSDLGSNPRLYQATNYISIEETQSEKLELEAGKSISINPGFETSSSNPFRAEIKNCIE